MEQRDIEELAASVLGHPVAVTPTSSGGDHASWWVGRGHVLRCAPDAGASARLQREVRLRELLLDRTAVPVPRSTASGRWRGLAWTLDERLAGEPADEVEPSAGTWSDLTRVLAELRGAAGAAWCHELALPLLQPPDLPDLVRGAERACRALQLDDAVAWLRSCSARAVVEGPVEDEPVVLHGDLKGEHLLVVDGRVSGVLDWADAGLGPASLDVEGLALSVGAPRAATVAAAAGTPTAEVDRGLFLARCRTSLRLEALLLRSEPSGPERLLRRQWTSAWAGTG